MKKLVLLLFVLTNTVNYAQFADIFAALEDDAGKFVTNYTTPVFEGLLSSTNANWTTSAKPIKPFKFELNIGASGAFVPPEKQSFKFNNSDYNHLRLESGPDVLPTALGDESHSKLKVVIPISGGDYKVLEIDAPDGIKNNLPMKIVPAPSIQLSMGLPLGTEVNIRYLPKITGDHNSYLQILGLGIKHSISQYFPAKKDEKGKKIERKFNLALHAAYQKIDGGADIDTGQSVVIGLNTINVQALASIDYKLLSIYGAVGYSKGFADFDVLGKYEYTYEIQDSSGHTITSEIVTVRDPLTLDYKLNDVKFNFGAKIKLFVFQIYADYTIQKYPVANVGIGFMF